MGRPASSFKLQSANIGVSLALVSIKFCVVSLKGK
jgi:hypothetical protein